MKWLTGKGTYAAGLALMLTGLADVFNIVTGEDTTGADYNTAIAKISAGFGMIRMRLAIDRPKSGGTQ